MPLYILFKKKEIIITRKSQKRLYLNILDKQNVNIGKKGNQNFVSIPFQKLVQQIEYKSEMVGITIVRITEEYTSQTCSSCGVVCKANRKYRGLYVCKDCGTVLNADVNASRNIIQKAIPKSKWIGDRGCLNHPIVLKI
ncbi:MAG: zinc ribbon domain-containing protein [Promethearchaeota archaeon]